MSNEPMTAYQKKVVAILAFLQFTVMVDFMILSPLGALLLGELHIDTRQFGLTVSAYALSAAVSSFASASIADKLDRRTLLLVVYTGFLVGTVLCGVASSYLFLLCARVVTGVFGGVIASISMAIVADVFPLAMRGRAMGTMMTAFGAAQVAGVPAGLALSSAWGWHAPFLVIAAIGAAVGVAIASSLGPLDAHLRTGAPKPNPLAHLARTLVRPAHLLVFGTTMLLASGFMMMPFLSAFFVNNLRIELARLPFVFVATGATTLVVGPLVGKLTDRVGKLAVFAAGSVLACLPLLLWTRMSGPTALGVVVATNAFMLAANTARAIPAGALGSAVPAPLDRGAFMSINSSIQQASGGLAALVGGSLVVTQADGALAHFDTLCFVAMGATLAGLLPMWLIDRLVRRAARTPRA